MNNKKEKDKLAIFVNQYLPYLNEVRKRLFFVLLIFILSAIIGFINFDKIIKIILNFYNIKGLNIVFTNPFQYINLSINIAFFIGILIALPLLVYQTISFLKPALKENEYRSIILSIPLSIILFLIGFSFGSYMMKIVINIFSQQSSILNIQNIWDIENFITNIFMMSFFMGILFQFPIVLTPLIRLKIIKYQQLLKYRILVHVGLLFLIMMLPGTDILTDIIEFFPLAILFEITLLLNRKYKNI